MAETRERILRGSLVTIAMVLLGFLAIPMSTILISVHFFGIPFSWAFQTVFENQFRDGAHLFDLEALWTLPFFTLGLLYFFAALYELKETSRSVALLLLGYAGTVFIGMLFLVDIHYPGNGDGQSAIAALLLPFFLFIPMILGSLIGAFLPETLFRKVPNRTLPLVLILAGIYFGSLGFSYWFEGRDLTSADRKALKAKILSRRAYRAWVGQDFERARMLYELSCGAGEKKSCQHAQALKD